MRRTRIQPHLILTLMMFFAIALVGTAMTPVTVSADGTGYDPPVGIPTTDSIPVGGGDPAADADADFSGDETDATSSYGDGLFYELMTLVALM